MIKTVKAAVVATTLLLASMGAALALTGDDAEALNGKTADQVVSYIESKGETVTVVTGEQARKFDAGLAMFFGSAAPEGTVGFIYGAADPADGTILVIVYDANDTVLGGAWIGQEIVAAAQEYANSGT